MKFSIIASATVLAGFSSALPTLPGLPVFANSLSSLAMSKTRGCDVSSLQQPAPGGTALPQPAGKLILVAVGKGTQNYTCPEPAQASAVPTAVGAIATLYNASCMAANTNSDAMNYMTEVVEELPSTSPMLAYLPTAGHHYFNGAGQPTFDLVPSELGVTSFKKAAQSPAPSSAKNAVPWLYLTAVNGSNTKPIEVYRLQTSNGAAPATCGTQTGAFTVEYSAQYWFYEAK